MTRILWSAALVAATLLGACRKQPPDGFAFVGGNVFDGVSGKAQTDAVVIVRRDKIEAIVPRAEYKLPKRTIEVDVAGKWILPGFIDSHAHIARWAFPRYLAYGVTTVRDMHGALDSTLALRDEANLGGVPSPRVYSAGAMIDAMPSTHADAMAGTTEREARQGVDRLAVKNAEWVYVYTRVSPAVLRATVDEARTFRIPVAVRLGLTDAETAASAGVRSIEQMSGIVEATVINPAPLYQAHDKSYLDGYTAVQRAWATLDSSALDRTARHLAERKVFLVPTLVSQDAFSRIDDSTATTRNPDFAAAPEAERNQWNIAGLVARAGWTTADFAAFRAARANEDLFLRAFKRAGGRIAAGSDGATALLVPGAAVHTELELLVKAGLTPAEALIAATGTGAALLGVDSIGRLEPGNAADLVVLTGNPFADIRNTRTAEWVMVRGVLMPTDSIRRSW